VDAASGRGVSCTEMCSNDTRVIWPVPYVKRARVVVAGAESALLLRLLQATDG
jgi:hypothetical protein